MKRSATLLRSGFTLMELLIVIAIIAIILLVILTNFAHQIDKGFDARRKEDLQHIKTAFEEYYNDHGCYPDPSIMDNASDCGGPGLQPYLKEIPCDPASKQPYSYVPLSSGICNGYRVLTKLSDKGDPAITNLGCSGTQGCGFGSSLNYGISAGTQVPADGFQVVPTPTGQVVPTNGPTPTSDPNGIWACTQQDNCSNVGSGATCSPKYITSVSCNANCTQQSQVISCP